MDTLNTIYNVCIILGLLLPILSLVISGIDSVVELDIALDGDADIGFIGFNFNCLLFSLLIFGSVGKLTIDIPVISLAASVIIAFITGAIGYVLTYRFLIYPLKNNKSFALNSNSLIGSTVKVSSKIPIKGCGEVCTTDATGCLITYLADYEFADDEEPHDIPIDSEVRVNAIRNNLLIVGKIF